jgi:hypothetical protein
MRLSRDLRNAILFSSVVLGIAGMFACWAMEHVP